MGIIEAITAVFGAVKEFFMKLPLISGWFTKTTEQKVDEATKKLDQEQQDFKNSGRGKW